MLGEIGKCIWCNSQTAPDSTLCVDHLMMVSCTPESVDALRARLATAERERDEAVAMVEAGMTYTVNASWHAEARDLLARLRGT